MNPIDIDKLKQSIDNMYATFDWIGSLDDRATVLNAASLLLKENEKLFSQGKVVWESFWDFDSWCVRPVGDRAFSSPRNFHVANREKAEKLRDLLNESM